MKLTVKGSSAVDPESGALKIIQSKLVYTEIYRAGG